MQSVCRNTDRGDPSISVWLERELLAGRGGQERRLGLELRADVAGQGVWIQPCLERLARECSQPAEAPSIWPENQRPTAPQLLARRQYKRKRRET